jgi:hypothetical protein
MPRKEVDLSTLIDDFLRAATPTLKDLADEGELGYATLRSWVKRRRNPTAESVAQLLDAWETRRSEADRLARELRKATRPRSPAE